jgi:hypothetical protein
MISLWRSVSHSLISCIIPRCRLNSLVQLPLALFFSLESLFLHTTQAKAGTMPFWDVFFFLSLMVDCDADANTCGFELLRT